MAKTCEFELREYLLRQGTLAMGPSTESTCAWALTILKEKDKRIACLLTVCKSALAMDHNKPYPIEIIARLRVVTTGE